jgi:hypothetical protein
MPEANNWNDTVITEFRVNGGRVGGNFEGTVERGTETYPVTVRELQGDERDCTYDEQARRYPGFADYAKHTAGIRTIPVLELKRSSLLSA